MILLTRKADFSAAHFYWNNAWTPDENQRVFGKCANRNGHGHNYTLEVTVAGEIDPITGFVVDLKQLKDIMEREVVGVFDHRHLNLEIPDFASTIPSCENIAVAAWRRLDGKVPNARLYRVTIRETEDLSADYFGDDDDLFEATDLTSESLSATGGGTASASEAHPVCGLAEFLSKSDHEAAQ